MIPDTQKDYCRSCVRFGSCNRLLLPEGDCRERVELPRKEYRLLVAELVVMERRRG